MADDDDKTGEGLDPDTDTTSSDDDAESSDKAESSSVAGADADAAAERAKAALSADSPDGSRRRRRKRPATDGGSAADVTTADVAVPDVRSTSADGDVSAAEAVAAGQGSTSGAEGNDEDDVVADRMDLPKWNRSRVKRKSVKGEETDAFQQGVRQAGKGAVRKAPLLAGAIALAAGGLAFGIYWWGARATTKADATRLLATAAAYEARGVIGEPDDTRKTKRAEPTPRATTDEELSAKVSAALGDLATTAADSPAHRVSRLVQAGRAMRAADFPAAEAAYRAYLDVGGDDSLNFLAREGMVLAIEAQDRQDDALLELEPLLTGDARSFFRDKALWHKGRILEAKGDETTALATYREYVETFPLAESSFARDQVVARLTALDPDFVAPPQSAAQGLPGMPNFPMPQ